MFVLHLCNCTRNCIDTKTKKNIARCNKFDGAYGFVIYESIVEIARGRQCNYNTFFVVVVVVVVVAIVGNLVCTQYFG